MCIRDSPCLPLDGRWTDSQPERKPGNVGNLSVVAINLSGSEKCSTRLVFLCRTTFLAEDAGESDIFSQLPEKWDKTGPRLVAVIINNRSNFNAFVQFVKNFTAKGTFLSKV